MNRTTWSWIHTQAAACRPRSPNAEGGAGLIKWLSDDCEVVLGRIVGDPRLPPRSDSGQGDPSSCCQVPGLGILWDSEGDGSFPEDGGRKRRVTLGASSSDEPTATVMRGRGGGPASGTHGETPVTGQLDDCVRSPRFREALGPIAPRRIDPWARGHRLTFDRGPRRDQVESVEATGGAKGLKGVPYRNRQFDLSVSPRQNSSSSPRNRQVWIFPLTGVEPVRREAERSPCQPPLRNAITSDVWRS